MKSLHLKFGKDTINAGLGDYLQGASAIVGWQMAHPGAEVILYVGDGAQWENERGVHYIPGATIRPLEEAPSGAMDLFGVMLKSRRALWETLGLDWDDKRYYYHLKPEEEDYAERIWGGRHPRIAIQWHGASPGKSYQRMPLVRDLMIRLYGAENVIVLDRGGTTHPCRVAAGPLRNVMAVVATADLFIGFDSGPFYAAIGAGVKSIGMFPCGDPRDLCLPVHEPWTACLWCPRTPDGRVPHTDIVNHALEMLAYFDQADKQKVYWSDDGMYWAIREGRHDHHGLYRSEPFLHPYLEIDPEGVFFDIGAHVGTYGLRMAQKCYRSVLVEPNRLNYQQMEINRQLNGITNVAMRQCGYSSGPGEAYIVMQEGGSYVSPGWPGGDAKAEPVTVSTLDADFASLELERVDLIKIDTEGEEARVLMGGTETLMKHKPRLLIECHQDLYPHANWEETSNTLKALGYTWREIQPEGHHMFIEATAK